MKLLTLLLAFTVAAVVAEPIKVTSKPDGGDESTKLKKMREHMPPVEPRPAISKSRLAGFPFEFRPKSTENIVPLKKVLESARSSPVIMDIVTQHLLSLGFSDKQIFELIASGKVTYRGIVVSLDDVSQICCPMGI